MRHVLSDGAHTIESYLEISNSGDPVYIRIESVSDDFTTTILHDGQDIHTKALFMDTNEKLHLRTFNIPTHQLQEKDYTVSYHILPSSIKRVSGIGVNVPLQPTLVSTLLISISNTGYIDTRPRIGIFTNSGGKLATNNTPQSITLTLHNEGRHSTYINGMIKVIKPNEQVEIIAIPKTILLAGIQTKVGNLGQNKNYLYTFPKDSLITGWYTIQIELQTPQSNEVLRSMISFYVLSEKLLFTLILILLLLFAMISTALFTHLQRQVWKKILFEH
jgi:hypothetical protein